MQRNLRVPCSVWTSCNEEQSSLSMLTSTPLSSRARQQAMAENFPEYTDCLLRLAAIDARCGRRADAAGHLRSALRRKPGNADALASLGEETHNTFRNRRLSASSKDLLGNDTRPPRCSDRCRLPNAANVRGQSTAP